MLTPEQEHTLESQYGPHWHELVVPRSHMEAWLPFGIFPPPLSADAQSPSSVHVVLTARDRWDPEGPPLDCTDEEGVEIQRARCEAALATGMSRITPIPGTDWLLIGPSAA